MPEFRKKPVVIEARQYDGEIKVKHPIAEWISDNGGEYTYTPDTPQQFGIVTLEGTMIANPGDWIIKGVSGEFYPCKPDIFAQTYEPIDG